MILRLLRLFPQFANLERELADAKCGEALANELADINSRAADAKDAEIASVAVKYDALNNEHLVTTERLTKFRRDNSRLARENERLKGEGESLRSRCAALESELKEVRAQLLDESHKVADTMSLHAIGKRVYSKADPLPPDYKPVASSVTTRTIPSQVSRQRMQDMQNKFNEMWEKLPRD